MITKLKTKLTGLKIDNSSTKAQEASNKSTQKLKAKVRSKQAETQNSGGLNVKDVTRKWKSNEWKDGDADSVKVILVRHGERIDEVGCGWTPKTDEFRYDCPLTEAGKDQASERGHWLLEQLSLWGLQGDDLPTVHSSPFLRCMQTATCIASVTKAEVIPVLGLGHCMAQMNAIRRGRKSLPLLDNNALSRKCTAGVSIGSMDDKAGNVLSTIVRLAQRALIEKRKVVVLVTHRETFLEVGEDSRPPYCGSIMLDFRIDPVINNAQWHLLQRDYTISV